MIELSHTIAILAYNNYDLTINENIYSYTAKLPVSSIKNNLTYEIKKKRFSSLNNEIKYNKYFRIHFILNEVIINNI